MQSQMSFKKRGRWRFDTHRKQGCENRAERNLKMLVLKTGVMQPPEVGRGKKQILP